MDEVRWGGKVLDTAEKLLNIFCVHISSLRMFLRKLCGTKDPQEKNMIKIYFVTER